MNVNCRVQQSQHEQQHHKLLGIMKYHIVLSVHEQYELLLVLISKVGLQKLWICLILVSFFITCKSWIWLFSWLKSFQWMQILIIIKWYPHYQFQIETLSVHACCLPKCHLKSIGKQTLAFTKSRKTNWKISSREFK